MIDKPSDNINWARIQYFDDTGLCCCKVLLWLFTVVGFAPTPTL
jgi:hypothetical protein